MLDVTGWQKAQLFGGPVDGLVMHYLAGPFFLLTFLAMALSFLVAPAKPLQPA